MTATIKQTQRGNLVNLVLYDNGDLRIELTDDGRAQLADIVAAHNDKPYADERVLDELLRDGPGDGFLGNGWEFAWSLDAWGHMTECPGLSNEFYVTDDGEPCDENYNLWTLDNWPLYPTMIERLHVDGFVTFVWWNWLGEKPAELARL